MTTLVYTKMVGIENSHNFPKHLKTYYVSQPCDD